MELGFEVTDLPPTDHPEPGDPAPGFRRPLVGREFWEDRSLRELYADGPVCLLFHSMDGAFPATYVWNEVRDRGWEGTATDGGALRVVGVSPSSPYEHGRFVDDRGIDSKLFADPANGVAEAYGVVNDLDGMTGVAEPRPAVFLVDTDGTVRYAWAGKEVPSFPDYDAVADAIAEL
jgi:peroxiredoxin